MTILPSTLRGRLLLANLVVAGAALGTVLVGVSLIGPGYFQEAMGHGPGDPAGEAMDELTLAAFREAVGTALLAATATALVTAIVVSVALATRVANPVARLAEAARRIAGGQYSERVSVEGADEVADLADSFNHMSSSLEATERRRVQLVGDVAHELRTPLSTIDGYLEALEDGVMPPTAETFALLRAEAGRLTRLVGDLSELWRAEAHQLPLHLASVEVSGVVDEVVRRFAGVATQASVTVRVEGARGHHARADRDRLVQILGNYLSNAVRHAPAGSSIAVRTRRSSGMVEIAVVDRGRGLSPEEASRVFERFHRLDPARSRREGGAGIGLAIARALAEAMGGRAWAESPGIGRGASFLVALPAVDT
jgi:two-component system, OmpR family, sensor histidine kinase BaeS